MKGSILGSLDNELTMLSTQKRAISSAQSQAVSKIAANPQQAKYLLSVERQQKVKESLYLFLLQKREENELSQAFTAYNTRLIEHPTASPVPVTPIPSRIMTFALVAGLFVPAGIIMLIESFNTAVRGRKDLQDLHAPFVGEIPLATHRKGKRRVAREVSDNRVVVKSGSRSIMNEAFRVVRTNLEFILGFDGGHHVVMLSSMNPGSGKTFTCANLSTALAIKGKKVIAVDLDLRRASLSAYVDNPAQGVSNYLSGQVADYHDVIVRLGELDVLPVGTIPPNPTELFFHPRFARMMEELKENYDYVILDCPPVEIVADAAIISRYAEMTLFIIRAHLMDRSFLADIENWYQERRYPNISVILNGTRSEFSHYGGSRYGYQRYGYHYGHYGEYTDSAEESEKRS
ncbi:polysaccharide biosynthesis tyrosine autokinase [Duncaniella muris]|nr:polysaccharide biosynthesis tyrosine autokinase [Duncaniella muris]